MSHLSRDVNLKLLGIEQLANELVAAANELSSLAAIEMNNPHNEGWDEAQQADISDAIDMLADNASRSISFATVELRQCGDTLLDVLRPR